MFAGMWMSGLLSVNIVTPFIDTAKVVATYIWESIPDITAAVTGNGIIMAGLGIWLVGAVVGMFLRLVRSV